VVFTALPSQGIQKSHSQKYEEVWVLFGLLGFLVFYFLFQIIHLEFISVLSDHFSFETTLKSIAPSAAVGPGQLSFQKRYFLNCS